MGTFRNDSHDVSYLKGDLWECIMPFAEMFLPLSASVLSKMEYMAKNGLTHSECRAEWEIMMKFFYRSDSDCHFHLRIE